MTWSPLFPAPDELLKMVACPGPIQVESQRSSGAMPITDESILSFSGTVTRRKFCRKLSGATIAVARFSNFDISTGLGPSLRADTVPGRLLKSERSWQDQGFFKRRRRRRSGTGRHPRLPDKTNPAKLYLYLGEVAAEPYQIFRQWPGSPAQQKSRWPASVLTYTDVTPYLTPGPNERKILLHVQSRPSAGGGPASSGPTAIRDGRAAAAHLFSTLSNQHQAQVSIERFLHAASAAPGSGFLVGGWRQVAPSTCRG